MGAKQQKKVHLQLCCWSGALIQENMIGILLSCVKTFGKQMLKQWPLKDKQWHQKISMLSSLSALRRRHACATNVPSSAGMAHMDVYIKRIAWRKIQCENKAGVHVKCSTTLILTFIRTSVKVGHMVLLNSALKIRVLIIYTSTFNLR